MHEIMTLEEVAAYLRVSEHTVNDWAQKGELPGGKLGTTWRFKRTEIEKWVNDRLSQATPPNLASSVGVASSVLPVERIILLDHATKQDVLTQLVDLLAKSPMVKKPDELLNGILERENLMSTGIGFGIGVPHVRINSVTELVMAVAICKTPITDYVSLDDMPVQIVCMLAARRDQHTQYIRTLSAISSRLRSPLVREAIIAADDPAFIQKQLIISE